MRRILLIGKNGQVGWELQRTLAPLGQTIALDRQGMDLADQDGIRRVIREVNPSLIVNAAAYTAVDQAEEKSDLVMTINGVAPGVMAEEAKRIGASIIHYSTDYVFDGIKATPYTEEDKPQPLSYYGRSKLAGEEAIRAAGASYLIVRTSWVYGTRGRNFLLTVLKLASERNELKIVDDQIGAPTWSRMIAETTADILAQHLITGNNDANPFIHESGIYNLSASGQTSWYGFAKSILSHTITRMRSKTVHVIPISSAEYPSTAQRPRNSLLNHEKTIRRYGLVMPDWEDALKLCLEEMA